MGNKVVKARVGDRWTKDKNGNLWLYRENENTCRMFNRGRETHVLTTVPNVMTYRFPHETDLPTPEAHAQLRKWGYEVVDKVADMSPVTSTVMPNGTVIETRYSLPGGVATFTAITESRVREIVEEVLAAHITTIPKTKIVDPDPDWRARCVIMENALQEIKEYWNGSRNERAMHDACEHNVRIAESALAAAPPPPDVSPTMEAKCPTK